ncbi:DUF4192 domain-containing protein [Cellulomonas massiliensis]|uniref:DUF4192 domain-containing protein n=1 Tax=Cellulomonas massiliensis TaxID=1465811 RepID=UPI000303956F|nr:DUF4192 domain-containing protein [Cellulomonas massiliensis]
MDTDDILRVGEPRELLALVPHRLGFHPAASAVAISLRGPRRAVGVVARVDLDELADPDEGARRARQLLALLARDGASAAVLVLYTEDDPRERPGPARDAADVFREAAELALGFVPAWVVTATGYLSLDCAQPCCPPGGRPLRELDSTLVGARMVLEGSVVARSRDELGAVARADPGRRRAVARARRRWELRLADAADEAGRESWRLGSVLAWREALAALHDGTGPAEQVHWGRIEAGLADRRVRDAVLVGLVPGTGDLPERCVRGGRIAPDDDAAVARAVASLVDPACAVRPPASVRLHEQVLAGVVAHGRLGRQAPAWTLLSLLAWWAGDGARARVLLDRALADDPAYRLAGLVEGLLCGPLGPGWSRAAG